MDNILQAGFAYIASLFPAVQHNITGDIITHSEQFFDRQDQPRYREALPRIFDIAVGIVTVRKHPQTRLSSRELEKRWVRSAEAIGQKRFEQIAKRFTSELAETTARAMSLADSYSLAINSDVEQALRDDLDCVGFTSDGCLIRVIGSESFVVRETCGTLGRTLSGFP